MKKQMFVSLFAILLLSLLQPSRCGAAVYAYVANSSDGTVSVINTADHTALPDRIEVGKNPRSVAVSPTGDYVFVVNRGDTTMSPPIPSTISRIKTSDNSIYKTIGGNSNLVFQGIAVSADGKYFYVTATKPGDLSGSLYVISTYNGSGSSKSIAIEKQPFGLVAFSKDDSYYVYVANQGSEPDTGTISVIEDHSLLKTIEVGGKPTGVAVSPNGDYVYVTNEGDDTVSVIKTADNAVIKTIDVGWIPFGIAVTSKGDDLYNVYVANKGDNNVSVIQNTGHTVFQTIEDIDFDKPFGVAATPNGEYVYVTNYGNGIVSVIQTTNNMVIDTIEVGGSPTSLGNFLGSISPPDAPTDLAATRKSYATISLVWTDNSSDESEFKIKRKAEGDADYIQIDTVSINVMSYDDTEVEVSEGATFYYRVYASNTVGDSDYTESSVTIPLAAPTGLSADADSRTQISLSWTDNSSYEDGFKIERKLVSSSTSGQTASDSTSGDTEGTDSDSGGSYSVIATVGTNVTSYTDTGLEQKATYSYRVRAFKYSSELGAFGAESNQEEYSPYSNETEERASDHCFIATAAYGSLLEPHVVTLRQFRDSYLLPHTLGRIFVETYYKYSPPMADFIAEHSTLRSIVRIALLPLIGLSYSILNFGLFCTLGVLLLTPLFTVGLASITFTKSKALSVHLTFLKEFLVFVTK